MADIHSFNVSIAAEYGVNSAILLRYFAFWVEKNEAENRHFHDGNYWTYSSVNGLQQLFPYMSEKSIRNAIDKLVDAGLMVKGNYNNASYDRTTWYALTNDGKAALQTIWQKGQMDLPKKANGIGKKGEPIPFSNTDKEQLEREHAKRERKLAKEESKKRYGTFNNVLLTDDEYQLLKSKIKNRDDKISTLSEYIESTGKKYKSHYATLLRWERRNNGGKLNDEREYF